METSAVAALNFCVYAALRQHRLAAVFMESSFLRLRSPLSLCYYEGLFSAPFGRPIVMTLAAPGEFRSRQMRCIGCAGAELAFRQALRLLALRPLLT